MSYIADSPEAILGADAESEAARIMQARGCAVLPAFQLRDNVADTKAPMFLPQGDGLIVCPDLLTFSGGRHTWVDVKGKSVPTWRRVHPGPRWEHGMDMSVARDYRRTGEATGGDVWILLRESRQPSDPDLDSRLVLADNWLAIRLVDAERKGEHRKDWPGGKARPNDRGSRGLGGLLWARNDMVRWRIYAEAVR